jgi:hypothetical protein
LKNYKTTNITNSSNSTFRYNHVAEQREAGLRRERSDLGSKRGPYMTTKRVNREMEQLMSEYTPERRQRIIEKNLQADTRARTREQMRQEIEEDEPMAKISKKGRGIRNHQKDKLK